MAVAFYTFILNLLNLAPIPPLDGSKIWIGFFALVDARHSPSTARTGHLRRRTHRGAGSRLPAHVGNLPPPSDLRPH